MTYKRSLKLVELDACPNLSNFEATVFMIVLMEYAQKDIKESLIIRGSKNWIIGVNF